MTSLSSKDQLTATDASLGQQPVLFVQGRILPPGEPPSYAGDIAERGYLRLLYLLAVGERTGRLRLQRGKEQIDLFFQKGQPVYAASDHPEHRLGEVVFRLGLLPRNRLSLAIQSARHQGQALGQILLREGYLTGPQIRHALNLQLKERILQGFEWRDGRYLFFQDQRLAAEIPTELDFWVALKEGAMLRMPVERCQSALYPLLHRRLARSLHPQLSVEVFSFSERLHDFYLSITQTESVADGMEVGLQKKLFSEESYLRFVYLLWQTDLLLIREPMIGDVTRQKLVQIEQKIEEMQGQSRLERLGLRPGATPSEIRRAYLKQARRFHPDQWPLHIHPSIRSKAEIVFALIGEAYRQLAEGSRKP